MEEDEGWRRRGTMNERMMMEQRIGMVNEGMKVNAAKNE